MNDHGKGQVAALGGVESEAVRRALAGIVAECRALDIRDYEERPSNELFDGWVPAVARLLDRALVATEDGALPAVDLVDDLREGVPLADGGGGLSSEGQRGATFYRRVDRALEETPARPPASAVADLAFLVRHELLERRRRLVELPRDAEPWVVVAQAGSALRRVIKALSALENLLARRDDAPPLISHTTELEIALASRRLYRAFTRRVFAEDARPSPPLARFRKLGTELAVLIGKPAYGNLRVADRVQFRRLQARILEWLRRPELEGRAADRLWQDAVGFARILTQINQRQELLEHDRAVFERCRDVARLGPLAPADLAALDDAEGRDERVDALLREGATDPERWRRALDQALRSPTPGAAPGLDESYAGVEIQLEPGDYEIL